MNPGSPQKDEPSPQSALSAAVLVETPQSVSAQRPQAANVGASPRRADPTGPPRPPGSVPSPGAPRECAHRTTCPPERSALRGDVPTLVACGRRAETDWDVSTGMPRGREQATSEIRRGR
jgi:hypothetical protein